jgi:hypothetical protein
MGKMFLPMVLIILALSPLALAEQIRGDYLETRSADVYTGSCSANGEVNLVGNQAILAWHIESGTWNGVQLDGLTVAAAVRSRATLGDLMPILIQRRLFSLLMTGPARANVPL